VLVFTYLANHLDVELAESQVGRRYGEQGQQHDREPAGQPGPAVVVAGVTVAVALAGLSLTEVPMLPLDRFVLGEPLVIP
jgi:hypothetical protein